MDEKRLGNFIAQRRKSLDMTQKDLASKLHVTDKAVSKWETGKGFPDLKMMEPLADALQELGRIELAVGGVIGVPDHEHHPKHQFIRWKILLAQAGYLWYYLTCYNGISEYGFITDIPK